MKKEIENRQDVFFLVDTFYTKVRADKLLGPIFNEVIDDWPAHLERLTDFWETNLFFVNKFKGNPVRKHQEVDTNNNRTIDSLHFGVWLRYWMETLETHFRVERASLAKSRARTMGTHLFLKIFENRST
ncbi:MAG: group III truncated hemoglobin [Flavobacteriaceae bacterium]|nr:group III truncated hemoglobin [Flavobacteriaceae bacterium]